MEQCNRINDWLELDVEQVQRYFFGNKERKAKFDEIWQSEKIQQELKKLKSNIMKAERELSQCEDIREEDFSSKLEDSLRRTYAGEAFTMAVSTLIEEEGKRTLDEILLDIISSMTVSVAIEEHVKRILNIYELLGK